MPYNFIIIYSWKTSCWKKSILMFSFKNFSASRKEKCGETWSHKIYHINLYVVHACWKCQCSISITFVSEEGTLFLHYRRVGSWGGEMIATFPLYLYNLFFLKVCCIIFNTWFMLYIYISLFGSPSSVGVWGILFAFPAYVQTLFMTFRKKFVFIMWPGTSHSCPPFQFFCYFRWSIVEYPATVQANATKIVLISTQNRLILYISIHFTP